MNNYNVKLLPKAYKDLDLIYRYICDEFKESQTAAQILLELEEAILSLKTMPYRGAIRKIGAFAYKGYHQLFVKNYSIIYRVDEKNKNIIIVTVRYSPCSF